MRIALIQPDSPYLAYPLAFPSLGLLYISAHLKRNGLSPYFYDLTGGAKMPAIETDIAAFSCQITHWRQVLELKRRIHAKLYVIGGPFPTFSPEVCRKEGFEVVRGEGEKEMLRIATGNLSTLDIAMFPDWDAIDLSRYGYGLEGKRCINIMTKRGSCPFHCAFCAKMKSPMRFRPAENVLAECEELKYRGFGAIAIYDDDVLINKKRDYEIFKGLKKLGMPYRCMTRTNLADVEDLKMLKETGCAEVCIGVETGDPEMKARINKGTTVGQDTHFVQAAKKLGLRVKAYLMIGLPGETIGSIVATRKWLMENRTENFDISVFTPYPGSDIYDNPGKYGVRWDKKSLEEIWFSGEAQYEKCAVYTGALTPDEVMYYKNALENEFKRGTGGATSYWGPL
jgi:radical SAM superfamily enzyme YgiQ (UPF0313 family)